MDKDMLKKRQDNSSSKFKELVEIKEQLVQSLQKHGLENLQDLDNELLRLQGEYRLVEDLLNKKPAKPSKVSPDATTLDVNAATEEK